ncbi:Fic family protein [Aeromicrobium fastidiosum]|uniref:Fic family protein n=1 Tax=Aeromicrobium fastidiosum TaxID=52699 RepID=A0A641AVA6_9ACTN|nr:Fic family protein [Aeromicrobium fastidiosum]KAA1380758.1 Fic family protein [Aeromicrobium fastidiosum]MBP2390377.1 Fic family protein [Aeromicrobium fastidiosum]
MSTHGESWPPVEHESRPWTVADSASQSQKRKHAGPYLAAVPPHIATLTPAVPASVAAAAEAAAREIISFDRDVSELWGAAEIAPMSTILLRTESASSSQIENLTVGARQLALAEIGVRSVRNARIVKANVDAMEAATSLADAIETPTVLHMHQTLLQGHDPDAGHLRDQQVWIGGSGTGPHRADFIAPHHSRVADGLTDLMAFCRRDDIPVIQQLAVAHAQFETIHPFTDGNGRTGRALLHAMIRNKRLSRRTTVPISAGLLADTDSYYDALTSYREGDVRPIVEQLCRATALATSNGRHLVRELHEISVDWDRRLAHLRSDAAARRLAKTLISQPAVNNAYVVSTLGTSVPGAQRAVNALVDAGILTQTSEGTRNRVWQAPEVLEALDEFGARIRRTRHHP